MRITLMVLALAVTTASRPVLADDPQPQYTNDIAIRQGIERAGGELIEAQATTSNAELQEQLTTRRQTQMPAPGEFTLTEDGEDLYDRADDGTLVIAGLFLCDHCDNYHANSASGFVISENGIAVTNYHVVESEKNTTMVAMTRSGRVVPIIEVLAASQADDIAIVRLGGDQPFTPVPIARNAEVGETVHAITHPSGRYYCYTSGEVSRFFMEPKGRRRPPVRRMQITADYARGSSGGPIFNDAGQVVGMVTTTTSVYYNEENGQQRNLQMVFKNTVPYQSILDLFANEDANEQADARNENVQEDAEGQDAQDNAAASNDGA